MDTLIKKSKWYKGVRDYQVQAHLYPGYIEIRVKVIKTYQWVFYTPFLEALPKNPFDLQRYILKEMEVLGVSYTNDTYPTWIRIADEAIKAINECK